MDQIPHKATLEISCRTLLDEERSGMSTVVLLQTSGLPTDGGATFVAKLRSVSESSDGLIDRKTRPESSRPLGEFSN